MSGTKVTDAAAQMGVHGAEEQERSLMDLFGVSVSKHLLDEHFTIIWGNEFFYDLIGCPKDELKERFHNHPDEYFTGDPGGFEQLMESVRKALEKGEKGTSVCLKLLTQDGTPSWVKLQVVFMEEYCGGYQVAYANMIDLTETMLAQEKQETDRQALENLVHEQDMLMSALQVSVSRHLFDEHYTCIQANEYYYQLIGYSKERYEELFHNHCDEYFKNNPEGWEILADTVTRAVEQGQNQYEVLVPMKYEDGSSFWIRLFGYFTDEYIDGCRGNYTVMTDVTDLVQMKNEQEMLMRAMRVSVSRHLVDEHFTVLWANDFYYELIGYSKEEYEALFHNHCDEYFKTNPDSWDKINEKVQEMSVTGAKSYELFWPMKLPDGRIRWVKMTGFFTDEYQDGKQIAYTTMVDVTELMQIQQEKAVAYDNIPGFIVKHRILADRIIMIDASERLKEIFDVDFDMLPSFDIYSVLSPESRDEIIANHPHFRRREPFDGTIRLRDKGDRERWFQIHSICIDTIADDPVYLSVFIDITDITELRNLQHKLEERTTMLNTALEEAKRANAAKSDFLSRMSHDIRTPMNAIFGMTTIAGAHIHDPERIADCLGKITVSSKLLLNLINEVLDMSKIESGRISMMEEEFSLSDLLQNITTLIQPSVAEKHHTFDVHAFNLNHEHVVGDPQRIQQVFLNLLSNAVKYTPDNGRILMEVREKQSDREGMGCYEIIFEDNGYGMKKEFLDKIFIPFERADDSDIQAIQGTGLGMAISQNTVRMMGGDIEVESAYGKGSRFTVTIYLRFQKKAEENLYLPERFPVLVVDNDRIACEAICEHLKEIGVACQWVLSGEEAVRRATDAHQRNEDYTAAFIDLMMPGMDGIETARRIRNEAGPKIPLLLVSSYDYLEREEEALAAGVNGFITKPLLKSSLIYAMKKYVLKEDVSASPLQTEQPEHNHAGKRLLLAEDNELNREIAVEVIGRTEIAIETAKNGLEALEQFKASAEGYYDLIFMDLQMPVMNGYESTRQIRALDRADALTVPIVAMTANAFTEDVKAAKDAGMNGHLAKPLDIGLLYRTMDEMIGK